jgi:hypothetical protein
MARPRVLFVHGLESSPKGTKARVLAEHFEAWTPEMDTRDFEACVVRQADAVRRFQPDVLVGSSFGGAVAVALLQRGLWRGPTLLLAQAALEQGLRPELPTGARVWIVHGRRDEVVPVASSRRLGRTGSPGLVRLVEVDDDHRLSASVASGRLVEWVRALAAEADAEAARPPLERHMAVFFQEPTLWPVLVTAVAGLASLLAWGVVTGLRTRNPAVLLAVSGLVVGSLETVRRDWRGRLPGLIGRTVLGIWALAALLGVAGARLGVL